MHGFTQYWLTHDSESLHWSLVVHSGSGISDTAGSGGGGMKRGRGRTGGSEEGRGGEGERLGGVRERVRWERVRVGEVGGREWVRLERLRYYNYRN